MTTNKHKQIHRFCARVMPCGNGFHIITPRSLEGETLYCLVESEYDKVLEYMRNQEVEMIDVEAGSEVE